MTERNDVGKLYTITSFRNGGRRAGIGAVYDDYGEESGNECREERQTVRFPNDGIKPEDLNGPVIIVQEGKKKEVSHQNVSETKKEPLAGSP